MRDDYALINFLFVARRCLLSQMRYSASTVVTLSAFVFVPSVFAPTPSLLPSASSFCIDERRVDEVSVVVGDFDRVASRIGIDDLNGDEGGNKGLLLPRGE